MLHAPLVDTPLSVQVSPAGVLTSVPPPADPAWAANVSVGGASNCAVTLLVVPVTIVTLQLVPRHAPE